MLFNRYCNRCSEKIKNSFLKKRERRLRGTALFFAHPVFSPNKRMFFNENAVNSFPCLVLSRRFFNEKKIDRTLQSVPQRIKSSFIFFGLFPDLRRLHSSTVQKHLSRHDQIYGNTLCRLPHNSARAKRTCLRRFQKNRRGLYLHGLRHALRLGGRDSVRADRVAPQHLQGRRQARPTPHLQRRRATEVLQLVHPFRRQSFQPALRPDEQRNAGHRSVRALHQALAR